MSFEFNPFTGTLDLTISVGGSLTGGVADCVLYINSTGKLACSPTLQYNGSSLSVSLGNGSLATPGLIIANSTDGAFGFNTNAIRFDQQDFADNPKVAGQILVFMSDNALGSECIDYYFEGLSAGVMTSLVHVWNELGVVGLECSRLGANTGAVPAYRCHIVESNSAATAAAVFQGYSDGGTATKGVLEIKNELSERMVLMAGSGLAGTGDYGSVGFYGTATATEDGFSFGDFNWINNSTESSGDKRVGTMRVYRDGDWQQSTFQLLVKNTGGFQYAIVSTYDNKTGVSGVSAPTARLHLPAGSATASTGPLKFTSGILLTTAEAGVVEFLTDKYYATITTGGARKELTLNDTALTSGRVPFATTNGRLTDDADMTFATDTLTVTKIAATTFTGNITLSTKNIVTDTTTGTQIATATTQKLGFFAKTPVVQQTDGANLTNNVTSGGTTDTIANYTDLIIYANDAAAIRNDIYQLARKVKIIGDALRTYGFLS